MLPRSGGKDVIMVVADRLNKYSHFVGLTHPYSADEVAQAFVDNVYKLHDLPNTIVSDQDTVFLSKFWQKFFPTARSGVELVECISLANRWTDGGSQSLFGDIFEMYDE